VAGTGKLCGTWVGFRTPRNPGRLITMVWGRLAVCFATVPGEESNPTTKFDIPMLSAPAELASIEPFHDSATSVIKVFVVPLLVTSPPPQLRALVHWPQPALPFPDRCPLASPGYVSSAEHLGSDQLSVNFSPSLLVDSQ